MSVHIRIERHGGPEVMQLAELSVPAPGPGEIRLRHEAIGLNFIDTYHRSGLYKIPLPSGLGSEAAGVVTAVGPGVKEFRVGERVAYAGGAPGSYCEERVIPAALAVKLPPGISSETAAALLLKGMTAYYLLHLTYPVRADTTLLVHAAAGGVGSVLVPWARHLGARVIGTAGGAEKCALARHYGCHDVIDYRAQDFVAETRRLTDGAGVDVVYDSVGRDTFLGSLDCLKRRGTMVSFGNASGKVPAFEPILLTEKGSLFFTRPKLGDYTATRPELEAAAQAVFDAVARGVIRVDLRHRYPLRDAARAHADLEARRTQGLCVLRP
ncbi:MAG: quinone oxidoreductase [Nevskia sp.]|nr:quinone oxidoreductase [Nevskia sp.]